MVTKTEQHITEAKSNWQPRWLVDIGHGCQCGITIDDHCYVTLSKNWDDKWIPTSHIPIKVAEFLGELVNESN
jgi:hypothetical protein